MGKTSTHIGAALWFIWYLIRSIKNNNKNKEEAKNKI
jgi:hypothetical protein